MIKRFKRSAQAGAGFYIGPYTTITNNSCQSLIRVVIYATAGDSITIAAPVVVSGLMDSYTLVFFGAGTLPGTNAYIRPIIVNMNLDNGNGAVSLVTIQVTNNTTLQTASLEFLRDNAGPPC